MVPYGIPYLQYAYNPQATPQAAAAQPPTAADMQSLLQQQQANVQAMQMRAAQVQAHAALYGIPMRREGREPAPRPAAGSRGACPCSWPAPHSCRHGAHQSARCSAAGGHCCPSVAALSRPARLALVLGLEVLVYLAASCQCASSCSQAWAWPAAAQAAPLADQSLRPVPRHRMLCRCGPQPRRPRCPSRGPAAPPLFGPPPLRQALSWGPGGNLLREVLAIIVGFFTSLLPGWNALLPEEGGGFPGGVPNAAQGRQLRDHQD
eukprot:jgi/Botrbrau1/6822/Bobra.0153s0017.1